MREAKELLNGCERTEGEIPGLVIWWQGNTKVAVGSPDSLGAKGYEVNFTSSNITFYTSAAEELMKCGKPAKPQAPKRGRSR